MVEFLQVFKSIALYLFATGCFGVSLWLFKARVVKPVSTTEKFLKFVFFIISVIYMILSLTFVKYAFTVMVDLF